MLFVKFTLHYLKCNKCVQNQRPLIFPKDKFRPLFKLIMAPIFRGLKQYKKMYNYLNCLKVPNDDIQTVPVCRYDSLFLYREILSENCRPALNMRFGTSKICMK